MSSKSWRIPGEQHAELGEVSHAHRMTRTGLIARMLTFIKQNGIEALQWTQPPPAPIYQVEPDGTMQRIAEVPLTHVCPQVVEMKVDGSPHTLEQCAHALLKMLPETRYAYALEICERVLHILPSQLIYGHLMLAADSGKLQAPLLDPGWVTAKEAEQTGAAICELCRQPFTALRFGQRYCGPVCGGKAATAALPPLKEIEPEVHPLMRGTVVRV